MKTNHRRKFVARLERDPVLDTLHCESHHNAAQHEKKARKHARNQAVRRTERAVIQEQMNAHP